MAKIAKLTPRSYEEFQASFEWIQEEGTDILRIPLPGFKKDQIKVQMDTLGNLRVSGESPLGGAGNRWRRFRRDFRIPENCNAGEIRAKFDDDVLDIVLPRLDAAIKPSHQQPQPATVLPQEPPAAPGPTAATKPRVRDDDQDHMIRSRKESTSTQSNIGGATPLAKPTVDTTVAAKAKEKEKSTGEPAGKPKDGHAMVLPEKKEEGRKVDESTSAADAGKLAADAGKLAADARRREEPAAEEEEPAGGVEKDDGAGKPKLRASLSFNKPNQLLLNVAVAVGVLVGLASYLAYNLGKSVGGTECHCH